MQSTQGYLFTGTKSVRLEDLPEEAWRIVVGDKDTAGKLYGAVAWLFRCVELRAGAVANMPWEIRKGEQVIMTHEDEAPDGYEWLEDLTRLLYQTEAAVALTGQAYWFRERNLMKTLAIRWMLPFSVKPKISAADGLTGFARTVDGTDWLFEVDDFVYFWLPDPFVELGPAKHFPGKAATDPSTVLAAMAAFLSGYFDRGMIKATLLQFEKELSRDEADRVLAWWNRVVSGIKNAFASMVMRGDFKAVTIGEGVKELQNTELTAEQREDICTAFGVPQSKLTANAANFATKQGDDLSFIQDTIAPECKWIAAVINKQLLGPMGLRLVFKPDELAIMQEDETQRANSLKMLVEAGMSLEMALAVLGYDLPEGIELREPKAETPPQLMPFTGQQPPAAVPEDGERIEETRRFTRWAKKRANPDPDQFESVILSTAEKRALLGLEDAAGADAPFRGWSDESYP